MIFWEDLIAALALVLILEGLMPFASPRTWRALMRRAAEQPERAIRLMGGFSMLCGVFLLYGARGVAGL